jgi:transcriptional regulator with XRE-family HTH domain
VYLDVVPVSVGPILRTIRESKGWSRATLARKSGIGTTTIARVELNGDTPTLPTLEALADALEVPFSDLLAGTAA